MTSLAELTDIHFSSHDIKERYRGLSAFFHRFLNHATADKGIEFCGPFAKLDYLLKENDAPRRLVRRANNARVRFKNLSSMSPQEMDIHYLSDLEAVASLVAIVEKESIPEALSSIFPRQVKEEKTLPLAGEYMRFITERWDDKYIYATTDLRPDETLRIDYITPSTAYPYDISYLRDILFHGAQLNIIRPRIDNDIVYPELIIFEPDILIDISAIAGCFETYATDARIALLKRLSPMAAGDAINLGNFAGQLLDEEIHSGSSQRRYTDSAMEFFRNNALALAAIPPNSSFHADAKSQQKNIRTSLKKSLPASFSGFNLENVMVEPSFFSEMLGLQGRMDMLQLDLKILAEQKSGKGEWPYGDFKKPKHRQPHYVQLLLYMLIIRYNYRLRYEENNRELNPFLLYSKYENSLLALGFAPNLVAEALKIRNLIVAGDIRYSKEGMDFLLSLSPDDLNAKGPSLLWDRYTRPQLSALLSPIHAVSDTERAYWLRFLKFISKEHLLAKVGNRRKENSGFASTWQSPLEEKIDSGNIYTGLRLSEDFPDTGKIEDVTLLFTEDERNTMANFRKGDVVILYSYPQGSQPDARRNMIFRATIMEIGADNIRLHLRAPQSSPKAFFARFFPSEEELLWAIEHDFVESGFTGLYRGVHSFLSASMERRRLLMMERKPETDLSLSLKVDHGSFNTLALHAKQARDIFLIVGPPGTGKTSFGLMTSLREELAEEGSNVVILAFTNRAVDEICSKLADSDIDYIRLGNDMSCTSDHSHLLSNYISNCRNADQLKERILSTRVFVATTTSLNASPLLFYLKKFSLAIIDEASQILEPHILGLLSARHPDGEAAIRRFIMIGDYKQLPAVVQQTAEDSRVTDPLLHKIGLEDCASSLFERFIRRYGDDPSVCNMLTTQGRMHIDIADFPNHAFYQGKLRPVPLPHQLAGSAPLSSNIPTDLLEEIIKTRRVAFINVVPKKHLLSDKVNPAEAEAIAELCVRIYNLHRDNFDTDRTVGVIVPYRNQIAAIRSCLAKYDIPALQDITIDTIERYQGSQRKYIIYGFTVSKPYQLDFLTNQTFREGEFLIDRKLNVAMTRAEEHLLMLGNAPLLYSSPVFHSLLDYLKKGDNLFSRDN